MNVLSERATVSASSQRNAVKSPLTETEVRMDGYERLANAIIIQAAKDYRVALRRLRCKPGNKDAQNEKESIERFFRSDWFRTLTEVDGEMLIRRLQEE